MAVAFDDFGQAPLAQSAHPADVERPGSLPLLDVFTAVFFQDDAADALAQEEVAERQPGDAASDDDDAGVLTGGGHVW